MKLTASSGKWYGPAQRVLRPLDRAEWDRLLAALDRAAFWTLPKRHDRWGLDGETWTIEGRVGNRYHASDFWSPHGGAYFDLGRLFVELAGL